VEPGVEQVEEQGDIEILMLQKLLEAEVLLKLI
jgi:hypothetical protein